MTRPFVHAGGIGTAGAIGLMLLARVALAGAPPTDAAGPEAGQADGGVGLVDSGANDTLPASNKAAATRAETATTPSARPSDARSAPAEPPTAESRGKPAETVARKERAAMPAASPQVSLSLTLPSPVLGIDDETELHIVVTSDLPSPLPFPRILCSTGRVEDLTRDGPAGFSARFLMPNAHFPQVAILVADFSHDSLVLRGSLAVRLRAATSKAFETDPKARVTVKVGEKEFGPVIAPADGNVRVPVVVPPGIDFGLVRSVRYGKSRQELVDLKIPRSRRVLVVAPERLTAGSAGEVAVLAVDPTGRPTDASTIVLTSTGPRPEPLGSRIAGEARFLVRSPAQLLDPTLHLAASLRGQPDVSAETDIVLVPAATAQITLQPEPIPPSPSPPRSLRLFLSSQDAFGNPTDAGEAATLIDGRRIHPWSTDDGRATILVRPPALLTGRDAIEVEAVLDGGHAIERIPLALFIRRPPPDPFLPSRYTLTPRLGLLWNLSQPPGTALFVEGLASRLPSLTGVAFGATVGYLRSSFFAGNNVGAGTVTLDQIPVLAQARYRGRIDRLAVSVGAGAGLVFAQSRLGLLGTTITGRRLSVAGEGSTEVAFLLRRSQVVLGLRYLVMGLGRMSSGDVIVGNTGGFILDAGYRFAWR
jgi:hypothetical protein